MIAPAVVLLGYLVGSFPSAYLAGRLMGGIDIRHVGDHNAGVVNVYREINPRAGLAVLLIDVGKGMLVVLIAAAFVSQSVVLLSGVAAVAGHNWPLYIGFKGGKGLATTIGVLTMLMPQAMLILLAIAAVPFLVTRDTRLIGVLLFVPLPIVAWFMGAPGMLIGYSIGLPCLVGFTHLLTTRHLPPEVKRGGTYMRRGLAP